MDSIEFGKNLKKIRESQNLSIRQLSQQSGVSHSYISQVENGKRGIPKPEILEKLASHLDMQYEALMEKAGYIPCREEEKAPGTVPHTVKDSHDIEKKLMETLRYIESQEGLMLNGEPLDSEDRQALSQAIKMGLLYAKEKARDKYSHKKGYAGD